MNEIANLLKGTYHLLFKKFSWFIILWCIGIAMAFFKIVTPQQVGRLTAIFSTPHTGDLWIPVKNALLLMISAQVGYSVFIYLHKRILYPIRQRFTRELSRTLLERVFRFSGDFFRENEVEKISVRTMEDAYVVSGFLLDGIVNIPLAIISIIIFGVVMIKGHWLLGTLMLLITPLWGYFLLFDERIQTLSKERAATEDQLRTIARELIGGINEIRSHFAFDYALSGFDRATERNNEVSFKLFRVVSLVGACNPLIGTLQNTLLYGLGALLCIGTASISWAGTITWPCVIEFMMLAGLFQAPVTEIADYLFTWRMSEESMRRVNKYLQQPLAFKSKSSAERLERDKGPFPVTLSNVTVQLSASAQLLKGITIDIEKGKKMAIVGPSGSGKSTILRLVTREMEATSGSIKIDEKDIDNLDVSSTAESVGYIPQKPILFNMNIRNNLLLSLRRPSSNSINDDEGSIDISPLGSSISEAELNSMLLKVCRQVGLERDILAKALDMCLPSIPEKSSIIASISLIQVQLMERISKESSPLVILFDSSSVLEGTIGENIMGPGFNSFNDPAVLSLLKDITNEASVYDELLVVGYYRCILRHAIATEVLRTSPGLEGLIPKLDELSESLYDIFSYAVDEIHRMPETLKSKLFQIAMGSLLSIWCKKIEAQWPEESILKARRILMASERSNHWHLLEKNEYVEGLSLRENLLKGRVNTEIMKASMTVDSIIQQILGEYGILDTVLCAGLQFNVGEGGKLLSGGQAQKLAIARVLLKDPSVLLLDEATSALDEISQKTIAELISKSYGKDTVFSVSHRLSTIRDYDRIYVIDRGQLVQSGTYDELTLQEGVFREMVRNEDTRLFLSTKPQPPLADLADTENIIELIEHIASFPFFASLSSIQLECVKNMIKMVKASSGEIMNPPGNPTRNLSIALT